MTSDVVLVFTLYSSKSYVIYNEWKLFKLNAIGTILQILMINNRRRKSPCKEFDPILYLLNVQAVVTNDHSQKHREKDDFHTPPKYIC